MINVVIGLVLYFLMVWGVVDIVQRIWAKYKAYRRSQPKAILEQVTTPHVWWSHYDYTFSDRGNHFTIPAQSKDEAWKRAKRLARDDAELFLVNTTGPHWEAKL